MSKEPVNRPTTPATPYGPATGVADPGRQPVHDDTPYTGDRGPDGAHEPGYVPDGPATGKVHQDEPKQPAHDDTPYEGDHGPDGAHEAGHAVGGPGHTECEHN